jgi:transcriptional regulator with XRE-family HTH domain
MNIGKAIRQIRKEVLKEKQIPFCEKIGTSNSYLSSVENGYRKPSIRFLEKICKHSGVSLPVIMTMSLDENDVKPEKREYFKAIKPHIDALIKEML